MLPPHAVHTTRHVQLRDRSSRLSGHPDTPSGGPDALSGQPDAAQLPLRGLVDASAFTPAAGAKVAGMSFGISGMVPSLRYE
jgi:hypothetical protein